MLRGTQIALIAAVCLWGLLSAFGNLLDWSGTLGAVTAVAAMSTWDGGGADWRAIGSPVLITTAALAIVAFKLLSALLFHEMAISDFDKPYGCWNVAAGSRFSVKCHHLWI